MKYKTVFQFGINLCKIMWPKLPYYQNEYEAYRLLHFTRTCSDDDMVKLFPKVLTGSDA